MAIGYARYSFDVLGFYRDEPSDDDISFSVSLNEQEVKAWLGVREGAAHECSLVVIHEVALNPPREAALIDIGSHRLPANSRYQEIDYVATRWPDPAYFFNEGVALPFVTLPSSLQTLFRDEFSLLTEASRRIIWALRWRFGVEGPLNWSTGNKFEFSLDGKSFFPASHQLALYSTTSREGALLSTETAGEVARLASGDADWLPHELLREAREQSEGKIRSALLLSVAAVEIGVKRLVAKRAPSASWLVVEAPSPPIVKIIEEYLPTLNDELNSRFVLKPAVLDDLRKAVNLRNMLAHRGEANIKFDWLHSWLRRCYDLLYLFDYLAGETWAARYAELHLVVEPVGDQGLPFEHFDEKRGRWVAINPMA